MFSFFKRKKIETEANLDVRKESVEVIAAKAYLNKTHPTLLKRGSMDLAARGEFNFIGASKNGEYTRYHFCEGYDQRIIFVVLCEEERDKIIQLFREKMRKQYPNITGTFMYLDSMKGMFIGEEVKHRFFLNHFRRVAFMSDDGEIHLPIVLRDEDMD